ncbi:EF-hand domain-containing protein [Aphelenchoides fujianensis]|nr:EF-hand domain-containing protein [Aphelenchoides fujianensis]
MRSRPSGQQSTNLPAHFVDSLRVLFDILDTTRTGLVPFEQIAGRWQSLPKANLPPSFLECLRRVTPPNGLLSFERFMAGFRLSLFDRQNAGRLHRVRSEGKLNEAELKPPAMGINGLLVEGPRKARKSGKAVVLQPAQAQHQIYASSFRSLNASQPSLPTCHRDESPTNVPLLRLPEPPVQTPVTAALMRRPASAGAARVAAVPPTVAVDRQDNYGVIMRGKKSSTPQTAHSNSSTNSSGSGGHPAIIASTKTKRAPLPPALRPAEPHGQAANYAVHDVFGQWIV